MRRVWRRWWTVWRAAWRILQSTNSIWLNYIKLCVFSPAGCITLFLQERGGRGGGGGGRIGSGGGREAESRRIRQLVACWRESNNLQQHLYQFVDIILFVVSIPAGRQQRRPGRTLIKSVWWGNEKKKKKKKRKKKVGNSEESHTRAYADEHELNSIYTSARDIPLTPEPNRWMKKLNKFNIITQKVKFGWVNRCHHDRLETGILFWSIMG